MIRHDGTLLSTAEALREAALHGHVDGYPLPILVMALKDWKPTTPSASVIASVSWRRSVLQALLDYYVRIPDRYALVRGSLVHSGFEAFRAPEGLRLIREKRMRVQLPKYEDHILSGQVDLYYPDHRRLEDYKTCSVIPDTIKPDHLTQLAVYFWLLVWSGFGVDSVAIDYIGWDDCRQVSQAEFDDGSIGEAIGHPLFQSEHDFVQYILDGWEILAAGFSECDVPSTRDCDTRYCRSCSLKWACDRISPKGKIIVPSEFRQQDFM